MIPARTTPAAMATMTGRGWMDTARPMMSGCRICYSVCCTTRTAARTSSAVRGPSSTRATRTAPPPDTVAPTMGMNEARKYQCRQRDGKLDLQQRHGQADACGVDEGDQHGGARMPPGSARPGLPGLPGGPAGARLGMISVRNRRRRSPSRRKKNVTNRMSSPDATASIPVAVANAPPSETAGCPSPRCVRQPGHRRLECWKAEAGLREATCR